MVGLERVGEVDWEVIKVREVRRLIASRNIIIGLTTIVGFQIASVNRKIRVKMSQLTI